jgi:hypothetical protein
MWCGDLPFSLLDVTLGWKPLGVASRDDENFFC